MVRCSDGSLYTGITTDLHRRTAEHNAGPRGAAYTRARRPVLLVFYESCATRSAATRRELAIKRSSRIGKERLLEAAARLS
ncbi:MAG: GIY-YIG nuclease family protein [Granulosicoccus sp.]